MDKFAERIIQLRRESGLSQEELGSIFNVSRSAFSGYESGGKKPKPETLIAIADYFGVTTDYLLGRTDKRNFVEPVFVGDNMGFKRLYLESPVELHPLIAECFQNVYLLLKSDLELARPERLGVTKKLLSVLQSLRTEIQNTVAASTEASSVPFALSNLLALQSKLKQEVNGVLDELLQADLAQIHEADIEHEELNG